jgi:hypothetical protein
MRREDNTGNRTRDLSNCSAVPQPTAPPGAPNISTKGFYQGAGFTVSLEGRSQSPILHTISFRQNKSDSDDYQHLHPTLIQRKTPPNATLSITNVIWTGVKLNQRPHGNFFHHNLKHIYHDNY